MFSVYFSSFHQSGFQNAEFQYLGCFLVEIYILVIPCFVFHDGFQNVFYLILQLFQVYL